MSYSAAEKWQKIGKVGADDKGSADVLSCYRPKLDLTAGGRLEVIENSRFGAALCCQYDEKEGSKMQRTRGGGGAGGRRPRGCATLSRWGRDPVT